MPSPGPAFISLKRDELGFLAGLGMTGLVDSLAFTKGPLFPVFAAGQRT
jgi:hypothetical protein